MPPRWPQVQDTAAGREREPRLCGHRLCQGRRALMQEMRACGGDAPTFVCKHQRERTAVARLCCQQLHRGKSLWGRVWTELIPFSLSHFLDSYLFITHCYLLFSFFVFSVNDTCCVCYKLRTYNTMPQSHKECTLKRSVAEK